MWLIVHNNLQFDVLIVGVLSQFFNLLLCQIFYQYQLNALQKNQVLLGLGLQLPYNVDTFLANLSSSKNRIYETPQLQNCNKVQEI